MLLKIPGFGKILGNIGRVLKERAGVQFGLRENRAGSAAEVGWWNGF